MDKMKVEVDVAALVSAIRENKAKHVAIVKEATETFRAQAKKALQERLTDLESGKRVNLFFDFSPPRDYSGEYDNAIEVFEMHKRPTILLTVDELRMYKHDKWPWKYTFLNANSQYSVTASSLAARGDEDP